MLEKIANWQEKVKKLESENASLRQKLAEMQRLATAGTMSSLVAHEFNNLLTPMLNYARQARNKPGLVDKALCCTETNGKRAASICKAILDFTSEQRDETTPVPVHEILEQTLLMMGRDPAKDSIEITTDLDPDMQITKNKLAFQQVLLNLILNARAALKDISGTRLIEISCRPNGNEAVVTVRDNGIGISADIADRIFLPFFTTRGSSENKGRGLGLAVCKEMLHASGGSISVESREGDGAVFRFNIPVCN